MIFRLGWHLRSRYRKNFRNPSSDAWRKLHELLVAEIVHPGDNVDLHEQLTGRLHDDRYTVVPWLDEAYRLAGAEVLEIGSGTGISAVALAEQGARVTGVDVNATALKAARARCEAYRLSAEFHCVNGGEVHSFFANRSFDIVIFFAVLEHMTLDERLAAIKNTWEMTRSGGIWCIVDTPNRLWYYDGHTSFENFYHWLPDDLARLWGTRSRRQSFSAALAPERGMSELEFARWGRGASFHEFDLALGDSRKLDVVSNKQDFLRRRNPVLLAYSAVSRARKYERLLEAIEPQIDPGFFRQFLEFAIRKP